MDNKRQSQICEMIKRNLGPILQSEGAYIFGSALVSVTKVQITPDLSQAKIYLSIYNAADKEAVLKRIINHTHVLKQALAKRIKSQVRRIPSIFFYADDTIDEMYKVDELLKSIKTMYPESKSGEEE